jgi:hypothetical protein
MKKRAYRHSHDAAFALAVLPTAVLFVLHLFFIRFGLYEWNAVPWLDIPMHLIGGASIAWVAWTFLTEATHAKSIYVLPRWLTVAAIIGAVAMVGIVWEWAEFIVDVFRGSHLQGGIVDTMKDLFDDLLGGTVAAVMLTRPRKRSKK